MEQENQQPLKLDKSEKEWEKLGSEFKSKNRVSTINESENRPEAMPEAFQQSISEGQEHSAAVVSQKVDNQVEETKSDLQNEPASQVQASNVNETDNQSETIQKIPQQSQGEGQKVPIPEASQGLGNQIEETNIDLAEEFTSKNPIFDANVSDNRPDINHETSQTNAEGQKVLMPEVPHELDNQIEETKVDRAEGLASKDKVSTKKYKHRRLLLGEGDFSFAKALITKHPDLAPNIVATELETEYSLRNAYPDTFQQNIQFLDQKNVNYQFGVDATQIDTRFPTKGHFQRIHFNYPHDKSEIKQRTLPILLERFFNAASQIQDIEGRVHVTIPEHKVEWRESYVYGLYDATHKAGYDLMARRRFTKMRYPGYDHVKTRGGDVQKALPGHEYIFLKVSEMREFVTSPRQYTAYGTDYSLLYYRPTVRDRSSDYEEAE